MHLSLSLTHTHTHTHTHTKPSTYVELNKECVSVDKISDTVFFILTDLGIFITQDDRK
jgi:sorbitol-specific phosphotransferase system component IIA